MTRIYIPKKGSTEALIDRKSRRKMLADTAKQKCPEINKEFRRKNRDIATEHYRNAVQQIRLVLSGRLAPPVRTAAGNLDSRPAKPYTISIAGARGKSRHRIVTVPWKALSQKYAQSEPANITFWHKYDVLFRLFRAFGLPKAKVHPQKVQYYDGPGGTARAGRSRTGKEQFVCRSLSKLELQRLPYPFSKTVSDSFLTASEISAVSEPPSGFDRSGPMRGFYPERNRPFIARTAATLGRAMYQKLRTLK